MKNYVQTGDEIDVVLAADLASGAPVVVGARVVVAITSGLNGATIACRTKGVYSLGKTAAQAYAKGAKLYFDDTTKLVTSTAGSNLVIGYAHEAALAADTTVPVALQSL